ncbi:MAG: hypothetical protein WCG93_04660 [Paludibacter sp.]
MERIKKYFSEWDAMRIFKLVFGGAMTVGYISTKETIYLFGGIMFLTQALFNIGCPGGSCATNTPKSDKPIIKIDKYEPKN